MKPFIGVVVKVAKDHMKIELRSGHMFTTKNVEGIGRGTRVEVSLDHTHNRIRDVRLIGERDVPLPGEPPDFSELEEILEKLNSPELEYDDEGAEKEVGAPSTPEIEEVLEIEEWEREQEQLDAGASSFPHFGE